ncbi:hypothetical protein [Arthrobacter alpinus]|uniref:hypothetical protein n=1 Tax=Arthrobacter alpinus TaxID=656366 RepID=UPI000B2F9032|nr:hypothetical protein [Arthrobacter alpinus]
MSQEPVEERPARDGRTAGKHSSVEDFIKLMVPEPDLLEEETTPDPDVEPRETGA